VYREWFAERWVSRVWNHLVILRSISGIQLGRITYHLLGGEGTGEAAMMKEEGLGMKNGKERVKGCFFNGRVVGSCTSQIEILHSNYASSGVQNSTAAIRSARSHTTRRTLHEPCISKVSW